MIHELPLERRTLHGHFSYELEPVLSIDPGDSVGFRALNAGWRWERAREWLDERDREHLDSGHPLLGPIEVRGARAGQTLVVGIDEVRPGGWGVTWGDGQAFHWTVDADAALATDEHGNTVSLAPFLGVIGMPPPDDPGVWSTGPPRRWGGNIDCKLLVAGTTLFLPIPVEGALFSAGDGHAAQGDGEVSGTAIETPVRAQLTLDVRDDLVLEWPCARIDGAWLAFGFDEHLGRAARIAVDGILAVMERELGLSGGDALALASIVVDLRVTQVVNGALGVHAVLRDDAIR